MKQQQQHPDGRWGPFKTGQAWKKTKDIRSVFICTFTFDIETHFPLDHTFSIPDGVAALVGPGDRAERGVALADADAPLVSVPGHPGVGQQHQSRSEEEKVSRVNFP